jgi:hypothetical protein
MPTMHLTITTGDIRPLLLRHGYLPRRYDGDPDNLIRFLDPEDSYCACHHGDQDPEGRRQLRRGVMS